MRPEFGGGVAMLVYAIIMFIAAAVFIGVGIAVYKGKTDLIHDYHQSKVTDKTAYGKAFGKALLVMAVALLFSGIIGPWNNMAAFAVAVLITGLCAGAGCMVSVQRKYNKGVF